MTTARIDRKPCGGFAVPRPSRTLHGRGSGRLLPGPFRGNAAKNHRGSAPADRPGRPNAAAPRSTGACARIGVCSNRQRRKPLPNTWRSPSSPDRKAPSSLPRAGSGFTTPPPEPTPRTPPGRKPRRRSSTKSMPRKLRTRKSAEHGVSTRPYPKRRSLRCLSAGPGLSVSSAIPTIRASCPPVRSVATSYTVIDRSFSPRQSMRRTPA